jgi:hypothetical protein
MSVSLGQFPENPGNDISISNLLNSIRNLYTDTKTAKTQTISKLRKLSNLDSAESRKLADVNRFKDRSELYESNLETYVGDRKGEITSFILDFDKNRVYFKSLFDSYTDQIDYLHETNKISTKEYREAQLYCNFISDYITYMETKAADFKDGRLTDIVSRYNGNAQLVADWKLKFEDVYTKLVNLVISHMDAVDGRREKEMYNDIYMETSVQVIAKYEEVIANYNSIISELNNLIGSGPEVFESEIAILASEVNALLTEIDAIQVEIDAYDAQLAPLYVERDGYIAAKQAIYNQWVAAKNVILVPLAEKQNQIVEINNAKTAFQVNEFFQYFYLKELLFIRDGAPLDDPWNIANGGSFDSVGRALTSEEQTQYDALVLQFESMIGYTLEVVTYETVMTAIQDKNNDFQSQIDALNVEISDLQAIIVQNTEQYGEELGLLTNENGDNYLYLMGIENDLFDAKNEEIAPIEALRAPFLVTKDEKLSLVDSKNSLIVTKQALVDDIDNAEDNLAKVTSALATITSDKSDLDAEAIMYDTKFTEATQYYNQLIIGFVETYNTLSAQVSQLEWELDNGVFDEVENINKNRWTDWKKSEIRYNLGLESGPALIGYLIEKDISNIELMAADTLDATKNSLFNSNNLQWNYYHSMVYAGTQVSNFINFNDLENKLIETKNEEFDLRMGLIDLQQSINSKESLVDLYNTYITDNLAAFSNIDVINEDFHSQYESSVGTYVVGYNWSLRDSKFQLLNMNRQRLHLEAMIERRQGRCAELKGEISNRIGSLSSDVSSYVNSKLNLINSSPGSYATDILGMDNHITPLSQINNAPYARSEQAHYKDYDSEFNYRARGTEEYLFPW